jgi:hypothetical protein
MNRCNWTRAMGRPPMMIVVSAGNDVPGRIARPFATNRKMHSFRGASMT